MRYVESAPRPALAPLVRCLWLFESDDPAEAPQTVVPDGCCELIVHLGAPYAESGSDRRWVVQPSALFAGQLTRPLHLKPTGLVRVAAVRFHPAGARRFVGTSLRGFTDRRAPLADLHGGAFADGLLDRARAAGGDDALWRVLQDHVESKLAPPSPDEERVRAGVDLLARSAGRASSADLTGATGLKPRTLERRFSDVVGISPRLLASVFRLRSFFAAREAQPDAELTELALAARWFDHAQMSRDFRRFLGCSPSTFLSSGPGLAASLAAGAPDALSETYKRAKRPPR